MKKGQKCAPRYGDLPVEGAASLLVPGQEFVPCYESFTVIMPFVLTEISCQGQIHDQELWCVFCYPSKPGDLEEAEGLAYSLWKPRD